MLDYLDRNTVWLEGITTQKTNISLLGITPNISRIELDAHAAEKCK